MADDWTTDPYFLAMMGQLKPKARSTAGRTAAPAPPSYFAQAASSVREAALKMPAKVSIHALDDLTKLKYKDLIRPPGVENGDEEFEEDEEEERQSIQEQIADQLAAGQKGKEIAIADTKHKPKAKQGDEDWPWKVSSMGNIYLDEMLEAACNTNPDRNGVDTLANNFHNYGCLEVLERRIMKFTKELTRDQVELDEVWHHMEVTAYFLVSGYDYWLHTGDRADDSLRLIGAMCFSFLSILPNGASDLKLIKNAPAIFGAIFEFLQGVLDIAPSSYQPLISWAPTLLAILEGAGVEIWDGHQALEVVRTKMGSVVDGEDKLQVATQKWDLLSMLSDARTSGPFGGTAHDLSKWTKIEKENGHLGPVRAKRMAVGQMYTSSDDEFTMDEGPPPPKRGKVPAKRGAGGGGGGRKKRVRSYC